MQNVIIEKGLRAHEKERYIRVNMLNSDRKHAIQHIPRTYQIYGTQKNIT